MSSADTPSIVRMSGVWASYKKKTTTLQNIDMEIKVGDSHAIVGPSGAGKSTLLKLINGTMMPSRGTILVDNHRPDQRDSVFRSKMARIGYIPQSLGLVRNSTVLDNVMMGALSRLGGLQSLLKRYPDSEVDAGHKVLEQVGLSDKVDRNVYTLSGGERRRVAIARAFMQRPKILLADEMISELDTTTSRIMMNMVRDEQKRTELTVIMIHHDIELATEFANTISLIKGGQKVLELGNSKNTITNFSIGESVQSGNA
ncbi:MAG: ATP-binding cassette domain-containing protein [Cenarchaeum sp. SB0665_bin_23]|nr:ATP-binding cassette domain-containing protein [Cenarchaeum sp. SB0667_bin_13]MXY37519.1 ATP-binding cassette domain-containing protein [Cenarchaeum sp. SB0664_bin_35]MXY61728.1 ATP-binding cassette domain-containing protein [Cenarchaeum sp. SB0665_bin_23]MXZ93527.1 ATP-binding cassette domain-containing protein [Cenarchaeum sp. SB0666_bin_15]MYB46695.1 ATP-binding cassette domain-containing protein [Cenarchaeum sp. SB0662_bin_33]MYC78918.1 ATP-binding cassette domain-containing protein [Ce